MRSMSRAALAMVATLCVAPALQAQTSISISAGAALPMGTTADVLKMGYNATASLGIKPPLSPVGLRIDGMYNGFDAKLGGGSVNVLAATANATLSGALMPIPMGYLIGGVGMYRSSASGGGPSNTDVGFNVGAGIKIPLTGFGTFLEARFHYVKTDVESTKFVPITFGITF